MIFSGNVVHGAGRGAKHPTLNLDVRPDLDHGVYAVWVEFSGERFPGAMNWGPQPSYGGEKAVVEIHLLSGGGDWYGREVSVTVVDFVRGVQKFCSAGELNFQIQQDVLKIREMLAADPS